MGKRKEAPPVQTGLKKAPPLPAKKEAEKRRKEAPPLRKAAGKKAAPAEKKAKRRSMRERSGLVISPNRCQRMIRNTWQGGKISKESQVIMAAMLQYFAQTALKRATLFAKEGPVTCAELQRAIEEMGWPKQSGLLRVHIVGAAMDVGGDDEGDGDGGDDEEAE